MMTRFCLFFILMIGQLQAGDLYSIILGDTVADNISESIVQDVNHLQDEISRIQFYTGMRLIEIKFEGSELYAENIYSYLGDLVFSPDDVVIFYYSGHGYRTPSKGSNPWPNLYFTVSGEGVDFYDITYLLKDKNPRLLLSICDCCNNSIPDGLAPSVYEKELIIQSRDYLKANYKKLFMDISGLIMIRSSEVGEYSWCTPNGALYTSAFLDSLKNNLRLKKTSWESILSGAGAKVLKYQTAVYDMQIEVQ
jgi:hypothetical protein